MGTEDIRLDRVAPAQDAHPRSREADLEAREAAVEAREAAVEARDDAHAKRKDAAQEIGAAADRRDAASDDRDAAAEKRENVLDRAEMMNPDSDYGAYWPERRNAGIDRGHAKNDRTASQGDRIALTEGGDDEESDRT